MQKYSETAETLDGRKSLITNQSSKSFSKVT